MEKQLNLIELINGGMLTPEQRKWLHKKTKKHGHAAPVGSGPAGEKCGTCKHLIRKKLSKTYFKCALRKDHTNSYGTDIGFRDPACSKWEKSMGSLGSSSQWTTTTWQYEPDMKVAKKLKEITATAYYEAVTDHPESAGATGAEHTD